MYQKNQNQTQVPNLNNASVQHPSTSQPGGMVPEARQALEDMKYEIAGHQPEAGLQRRPSLPSGGLHRRLHGQAPD